MPRHKLAPESQMMSYGYEPSWSEGAIKPPIFQTSTFVFNTAEEGKAYFELAYGLRQQVGSERPGLIYSRINNPNLEILENRLCLWDQAEACAIFESGMSAISTVLLEYLKPGDLLLYSSPVYGGTDHFIHELLPQFGVHTIAFDEADEPGEIIQRIEESGHADRLRLVFVETPANPTNTLIDLTMCKAVADYFSQGEQEVQLAVDNTYMGPLWSHPLQLGADLVIYSATKYIGGHSDLIAGAVLGKAANIKRIKTLRTFLGNMASPNTCWLLLRSLETLKVRMEQQTKNAAEIAQHLQRHSLVEQVHYLGLLQAGTRAHDIYQRQYSAPGAMISFRIRGERKEAFTFLNNLRLFHLAVSLGSTESLAQHPATMTHVGVAPATRQRLGITDQLIRLSVGVENVNDLIWDIDQAFEQVEKGTQVNATALTEGH